MNSIIKHFEFKSSEGMGVSIDAARFKGKPVFLAVPLARALGYTCLLYTSLYTVCECTAHHRRGDLRENGDTPRTGHRIQRPGYVVADRNNDRG